MVKSESMRVIERREEYKRILFLLLSQINFNQSKVSFWIICWLQKMILLTISQYLCFYQPEEKKENKGKIVRNFTNPGFDHLIMFKMLIFNGSVTNSIKTYSSLINLNHIEGIQGKISQMIKFYRISIAIHY